MMHKCKYGSVHVQHFFSVSEPKQTWGAYSYQHVDLCLSMKLLKLLFLALERPCSIPRGD